MRTLRVGEKRTVCAGRYRAWCMLFKILFCAVRSGVGFQEGILEFDQMLLAKLGIYYLKQFILETVCHILALKKAKHFEAESNTFQGINIYQ